MPRIVPPARRRSLATLAAGAMFLVTASALDAHDFWLVPNAFIVAPGGDVVVRGQTSSRFPTSESAVAPERVADARVIEAGGTTSIRDLSVHERSLRLSYRPAAAGQAVVAVTTRPRSVRESAESFRRYLELEGVPELVERYRSEGRLPSDSVTRRYTKYAKALVEVGQGGPRVYDRTAGHPLEFMPLADPAGLRAGGTFAVRLLLAGRPLSGVRVHASGVPMGPGVSDEQAAAQAREATATTGEDGIARFDVPSAGLWNVRALHIVPAETGSGADWDAHWASMVFGVGPASASHAGPTSGPRVLGTLAAAPAAGRQPGDSAAVAEVVHRFHGALESGDSATALSLLAEDAVIQESGGVETRAEYRGHHLPGDIEFARAVRSERGPVRVRVAGDAAWASSTSTTQGEFRGRAINSAGAELMVLVRTPQGWRIAAIHWSSRARR
jgi:uncharacterized GH25 family protein/ketosteroid isomerase-like protein